MDKRSQAIDAFSDALLKTWDIKDKANEVIKFAISAWRELNDAIDAETDRITQVMDEHGVVNSMNGNQLMKSRKVWIDTLIHTLKIKGMIEVLEASNFTFAADGLYNIGQRMISASEQLKDESVMRLVLPNSSVARKIDEVSEVSYALGRGLIDLQEKDQALAAATERADVERRRLNNMSIWYVIAVIGESVIDMGTAFLNS